MDRSLAEMWENVLFEVSKYAKCSNYKQALDRHQTTFWQISPWVGRKADIFGSTQIVVFSAVLGLEWPNMMLVNVEGSSGTRAHRGHVTCNGAF